MVNYNIAQYFSNTVKNNPDKLAVIFPIENSDKSIIYDKYTFKELDIESDRIAYGLESIGIKKGVKTLLMVKPSLEFFALTFAIFKVGAVPILIDPGMGIKRLLECIRDVEPEAFIGIEKAQLVRALFKDSFKSVKINVIVGKKLFFKGYTLQEIKKNFNKSYEIVNCDEHELAAILFTTGSTGPAKGVEYHHGIFQNQCDIIREQFNITKNDIDMPIFPLFALFSNAIGMTVSIPNMDPTKPAKADPKKILKTIKDHNITFSFGSPALWNVLVNYCMKHSIKLESIKTILMAGAPISVDLIKKTTEVMPNVTIYTPYGATESLPMTKIDDKEILKDTYKLSKIGKGTCVGKALEGIEIKIIKITDKEINSINDVEFLKNYEIGEVIVRSKITTLRYHNLENYTKKAKIYDGKTVWHRMGDVGYFDDKERLWFCGRKSHRVVLDERTLFTVPCESIFNNHKDVFRTALVGPKIGDTVYPVIIVEPIDKDILFDFKKIQLLRKELFELAKGSDLTKDIKYIFFHNDFPVDIRHNAKISREILREYAKDILINNIL